MASSPSSDLRAYAVLDAPAHLFPAAGSPRQHEHKYLLDDAAARFVWTVASTHLPSLEDPARPIAYVRTTYFDTPDLAYYRSARGPVSQRIRVREYATATALGEPPRISDRCFLELKRSAGGRREKTRLELEPGEVAGMLARHLDAPLAPVLTTWYRRRSLADLSDTLRITLDEKVCFCAPAVLGSPCAEAPVGVLAHGPERVLEIKRWRDEPRWLAQALRGLHEAVGFSKFTAGMLATAGAR